MLSLLLLSGMALAAPPKPVNSQDKLFAQLKQAQNAEDAKVIEGKLKLLFRASNSPSVDLLMTRANAAQAASDTKTARKLIESVTQIAPNYAEGWHSRAALEQAGGDDTNALVSLQKTVLLNPRHFEAMVELAGLLEEYGDKGGALKLYRRALEIDPKMEAAEHKVRELTTSVEGRDI